MVIGIEPYNFIAKDYGKPVVIAGFEPLDLLQSVLMVLQQIRDQRAEVENQYARIVPDQGNPISLAACDDVYERRARFEWRGLGEIDRSGLKIRDKYARFDAEQKFGIGYGRRKSCCSRARRLCLCTSHDRAIKTGAMSTIWQRLHARTSAWGVDGFFRRVLCRLLSIWWCASRLRNARSQWHDRA